MRNTGGGAHAIPPKRVLSRVSICLLVAASSLTPTRAQTNGFETAPLSGQALQNVVAYTRLLGYVQFFHPSDQASAVDWEAASVYGMQQAEGAQTPADLARTLQSLFAPYAPTVLVYPTGQTPQIPPGLAPSSTTGLSVTRWDYLGYPGEAGVYSASRISAPVLNGAIPSGFTDPVTAFQADLGGGVSCFVPVDLYVDNRSTLPRPSAPAPTLPAPPWSLGARAVRLALIAHAWNIPQHFGPYLDVVNTDWLQALSDALTAAAISPGEPSFYNTFCQLGAALRDGHVSINSGRMQTLPQWIPPLAWDWIEGNLVVTYVADSQGQAIHPGDAILSIDGQAVSDLIVAAESLISGASQQWLRYEALTQIGAGDYFSTTQMQIESGGNLSTVTMTRTIPTSLWEPLGAVPEPRPLACTELAPGIFYVDVTRFTTAEWNACLPTLATASGIVFDYRGYPQIEPFPNLTATVIPGLQWLIPKPLLPDRTSVAWQTNGWADYPAQPLLRAKTVFLTDGRAISYAETSLGVVETNHLGDIVGGPSAGTDGNVASYSLFGLYYMGFTGLKALKADGSQFHGIGVRPTVPVQRTRAGVAAGIDEVLARGVTLLSNPGSRPVGPWVSSAASYLPESVSPGAILCIFASSIGPASGATLQLNSDGLVSNSLNGVQVLFDGYAAPLLYVGPTQINAIVPYEIAGQTHAQMTIQYQGQNVLSLGVAVMPSAPAIFTADMSGTGQGAILNQDYTSNSAAHPADRGSIVSIYATGYGATNPAGVDGQLAAAPLPQPLLPVSVRIGGIEAEIQYAGAAPTLVAGVIQVNAVVPLGITPGDAAVFLTVGNATSQPGITVNVR